MPVTKDLNEEGVFEDPDRLESLELQEFLLKAKDKDGPFKTELHRVIRRPGETQVRFSYLRCWSDQVPEYEQIGELYGPGEYRRSVYYTSKATKKRKWSSERFHIDPDFGQDAPYQAGRGDAAAAAELPAGSGAADLAVVMFGKALEAISRIAEAAVSNPSNAGAPNLGAFTEQIGQLTMGMFTQQQKMIQQVADAQLGQIFGGDQGDQAGDQGAGAGVFELLKWLWKTYGAKLLGASPLLQGLAREKVSSLPQVADLYKDPAALSAAMARLESEEGIPREHIDQVIGILGLKRPDSVIFRSADQAQQTPAA